MTTYKKGDKIKLVKKGCLKWEDGTTESEDWAELAFEDIGLPYEIGQVAIFDKYHNVNSGIHIEESVFNFSPEHVALAEKNWDNLSVEDMLVDEDDEKQTIKVLGIAGLVVLTSVITDFNVVGDGFTIDELKKRGYKIKEPEEEKPKERTVKQVCEELGYEVKIIKE